MKALVDRFLALPWPARAAIALPLFPLIALAFLVTVAVGVAEDVLRDISR